MSITTAGSVRLVLILAMILPGAIAHAADLPAGGRVSAGAATIGTGGAHGLVIDQAGGRAIIEWNRFSIGQGGSVRFNNGNGATLNRVTGTDLSAIHGTLTASGSVFLVNPNGILIGPTGVIRTGGSFVASTLDVMDDDFLDGGDLLFSGDSAAQVVNYGSVSALGGDIGFIARTIVNEGTLSAPQGVVGLAAGREVLLRDASLDDGKFLVKVGESSDSITEAGVIEAAVVELKANNGNIYALAGNTDGTISATGSVTTSDGRILLTAGNGSITVGKTLKAGRTSSSGTRDGGEILLNADVVRIAGLLDASGENGAGGRIDIGAGSSITLTAATLDVSGTSAGGSVRVGGEYQGGANLVEDEVENVARLSMDAGSRIDASASSGDGGSVILWSEVETGFRGTVAATGGSDGSGGFVEVSSAGRLAFAGTVDTGGGTLLLDPVNVDIGSDISVSALESLLESNNVVITTHGAGSDDGDITVSSGMWYDSPYDLSLLAHGDIIFSASIVNENETSGAINLVAGWDGSSGLTGTLTGGAQTDLVFDHSVFDGADLSGTTIFGNNGGSVMIGDGRQYYSISVGSRSGATRVYARNLALTGVWASEGYGYVQLGFHVGSQGAGYVVSGDIRVRLTGDLAATAGPQNRAYAQIGHGGSSSSAELYSGSISIAVNGNATFTSGDYSEAYAQIGHGSANFGGPNESSGSRQGDISITLAGELSLEDGSGTYANVWIGHGTSDADGISNADLRIRATGVDASASSTLASGAASSISSAMLQAGLAGGSVWIDLTDTGLSVTDVITWSSDSDLTLITANDIILASGASLATSGSGNVILAAGGNFHNDTSSSTPITVGSGRWLVYSTRPDANRNDIGISNRDFLQYALAFDSADPTPSTLSSGNGLVYSVTPVVTLTASDQVLALGENVDSAAFTITLTVDGEPVDADAFGIDLSALVASVELADWVALSSDGAPDSGSWPDALVFASNQPFRNGISLILQAGDLTVEGEDAVPVPAAYQFREPVYEGRGELDSSPAVLQCEISDSTLVCETVKRCFPNCAGNWMKELARAQQQDPP